VWARWLGGVALGPARGRDHAFVPVSWTLVIEFCAVRAGADRFFPPAFSRRGAEPYDAAPPVSFWIIALVIAVFVAAPAIGGDVELRESLALAHHLHYAGEQLNVMLGYAGYINFGSIVFFGLGGYIWVMALSTLTAGRWRLKPARGRDRRVERAGVPSSASASCGCAARSSRCQRSASSRVCRPSCRISSRGAARRGSIFRRKCLRRSAVRGARSG